MYVGFKNRFQDNDLAGAIIAGRTGSNWVHAELIYENGISVSSWVKTGGVALRPTIKTIQKPAYWEIYDLGNFDTGQLDAFLKSQIGKGYDWRSIFLTYGIPLQKQDSTRWTCAELVHYALVHYTPVNLPNAAASTLTPGQLRGLIINSGYKRIL